MKRLTVLAAWLFLPAFFLPAQNAAVSLGAGTVKIAVIQDNIRPGDPFVVALAGPGPVAGAARGKTARGASTQEKSVPASEEKRLSAFLFAPNGLPTGKSLFFSLGEESLYGPVRAAVLAVPSTCAPGRAAVRVLDESGAILAETEFTIEKREFRTETLPLTPAMSNLLTVPDPQKTREAEILWKILNHTGKDVYAAGNFVMPVVSEVQTSRFGVRRINKYPSGKTSSSIHAGIDYRAPEGTPITVCAPGRVVFAAPRIVTGNTVIIEHMPGVYSLCYHLSKISLSEGAEVQAGDPLGEAGSTGFSTAPHLHWEVRVAGENTDPEAFLNRPLLDKNAILDKLNQ